MLQIHARRAPGRRYGALELHGIDTDQRGQRRGFRIGFAEAREHQQRG